MAKVMDALMAIMEDEVKKIFTFLQILKLPGFFSLKPEVRRLKQNNYSVFIILIQFFYNLFSIFITSYINFLMLIYWFVVELFLLKYKNPSVQIKISRPPLKFTCPDFTKSPQEPNPQAHISTIIDPIHLQLEV